MSLQTGDYKVCIDEANCFLEVAKWCSKDAFKLLRGYMYPFAVNAALSCELYIKAIMMHNSPNKNEFEKGHDLQNLFGQLLDEDKTKIETLYNQKSKQPLSEFLQESKNAFVEWRYALEQGVKINVVAVLGFAEALKEYIDTFS